MESRADARAVPRAAREGHRAALHGRVRPRLRAGHVQLRRLRGRALRLGHEVRLGLRLAGLLRACQRGRGRRGVGHDVRNDPHRSAVRELRRPPGARVPRRAAPDRAAVLHQLRGIETGGGVVERKATFGAGCFWGVEAAFRQLEGVTRTRVGYTGGHTENPSYEDVCSHTTGHAEVVEVTYDDEHLSYDDLLKVFWGKHDPTQLNRQGWDVGDQYRSAVFFHDGDQQEAALRSKAEEQRSEEH